MKFKEKEYDEKYERLLNLLEKENLLLRDEIRREDEVINILLDKPTIRLKIIHRYPQLVTIIAP